MKTNIAVEAENFLNSTGFSARKLAREAGVNPVILTRVLSGTRRDMMSENADRLRSAMKRLSRQIGRGGLPSSTAPSELSESAEDSIQSTPAQSIESCQATDATPARPPALATASVGDTSAIR